METFNPLQCYTAAEVGKLMHSNERTVRTWQESGLLKGIKSGKATVYTAQEIANLQSACLGEDISNLKKAMETNERLKEINK